MKPSDLLSALLAPAGEPQLPHAAYVGLQALLDALNRAVALSVQAQRQQARQAQALEVLGQHHPGIDVQVVVLTSQETVSRLALGTLDVGLVALPMASVRGVTVMPWRRDPVMAFVPSAWAAPRRVTPQWLAGQPLILNDDGTSLSRLTSEWLALAGEQPKARIQLNYNDAIKSLVAAGYGATLLPHEASTATPLDPRIRMLPVQPRLWRPLGIAHRAGPVERATQHVLDVL